MFCPSSINLRTTPRVFSTRPSLNIQQGKKYEEKRFKFTSQKSIQKQPQLYIFKDLGFPNLVFSFQAWKPEKKQISLRNLKANCNPKHHFKITQHLWILLVLGCSKVFVATMSGKLCSISFHIPSGCTLVVCTTQGFNPKAAPMTSGKNKG